MYYYTFVKTAKCCVPSYVNFCEIINEMIFLNMQYGGGVPVHISSENNTLHLENNSDIKVNKNKEKKTIKLG